MAEPGLLRVGVIGAGFGRAVHVPAFRAVAGCEVRALCASSPERAAAAARQAGIPRAHGHWKALVDDPEVDAVAIAAPPAVQAAAALYAVQRGKHVFCEKPLADSLAHARELRDAARASGLAHAVDFEFLEDPAWRAAAAWLERGGLGRPRHVAVSWHVETYANRAGLRSWKTAPSGGALNLFVSHTFYYLERLAGRVRRLTARLGFPPGDPACGETSVDLLLDLDSGATASVSVGSASFEGGGHRVAMQGGDGALILSNPGQDYIRGFELRMGARREDRLAPAAVPPDLADRWPEDGRIAAVARLAGRFAAWARGGPPARPDFHDGLRVQAMLDAARRSHATSAWVDVPADA